MKGTVTAVDVLDALRTFVNGMGRLSALDRSKWVLLSEVRLGAYRGANPETESRIDALAIRLQGTPRLLGYEIKVDRYDLASELANGAKREPWQGAVNAFDLVVPKGLTTAEEIEFSAPDLGLLELDPETGLLERTRYGFSTEQIPPPTWDLVVSLLRSATR